MIYSPRHAWKSSIYNISEITPVDICKDIFRDFFVHLLLIFKKEKYMFNKLLVIISVIIFTYLPVVSHGDDAGITSEFIRNLLGGDNFEASLLSDYPGSELKFAGEVIATGEKEFVCLVGSEFKKPGEDPVFYLYEVKVKHLNPPDLE